MFKALPPPPPPLATQTLAVQTLEQQSELATQENVFAQQVAAD